MKLLSRVAIIVLIAFLGACGGGGSVRDASTAQPIVINQVGLPAMESLRQVEADVLSSGQPSQDELAAFAAAGVTTVIDLRGDDEDRGYDELGAALDLGMDYVTIPISGVDSMDEHAVAAFADALDRARGPVLVHCRSGSRVGAMVALRAARGGLPADQAISAGFQAGMGSSLEQPVRERIAERVAQ